MGRSHVKAEPITAFAIKAGGNKIDLWSIDEDRKDVVRRMNRPSGDRVITVLITEIDSVEKPVPKPAPKLSEAQISMLQSVRDTGVSTHHLRGRSAMGGASNTLMSLFRLGLLVRPGKLTEAGRAALQEAGR